MRQSKWMIALFSLLFLSGTVLILSIIHGIRPIPMDMAEVNRIVKSVEVSWESKLFSKDITDIYDYAVLDSDGVLLYRSEDFVPATVFESVKMGGIPLDITIDGTICGKVLIDSGYEHRIQTAKKQFSQAAVLLFLLIFIPAISYLLYLDRQMVRPFRKLKDFAHHIAIGNLDIPLPMDRSHIFGAFSESFDLMREHLKESRLKEATATQSKKELVASLSHDIKTPVTSIKLTSELLLATELPAFLKTKLETIYQKSEQIDQLISNMLQASLEDLGQLKVEPMEESSALLEDMIRRTDYDDRVTMTSIPECLIWADPLRMEQIIGNILSNSYKYADTPITILSALTETGLCLEFKDYGKGVPEEELPYLFQKFYRGTHRKKVDGSGLGLYISRYLMEQMNGQIECFNRKDGFSVELFIPFASTAEVFHSSRFIVRS